MITIWTQRKEKEEKNEDKGRKKYTGQHIYNREDKENQIFFWIN